MNRKERRAATKRSHTGGGSPDSAQTTQLFAEAAQLRREIAAEMKDAEIGQAQRAARDWLKMHPEPAVQQPMVLRAAA